MRWARASFAVGAWLIAAACTGEDPPFTQPVADGGGASSSGGSTSSGGVNEGGVGSDSGNDGPYDPKFGTNGVVQLDTSAMTMAVYQGGEVVWTNPATPPTDTLVHRLTSEGKSDTSGLGSDLINIKAFGPNVREVATAAAIGHRGTDDVLILGGRGGKTTDGMPTAWARGYVPGKTSPSPLLQLDAPDGVDDVVGVVFSKFTSEGQVYGAWTAGAADNPSAYVIANGGKVLIADGAKAGGIVLDPTDGTDSRVYAVARPVSGNKVTVVRANGISVTVDTSWLVGSATPGTLVLDVNAVSIASVNIVALDEGKILVGGTTSDSQLVIDPIDATGKPDAPRNLPTGDLAVVNVMLRRGTNKLVVAGCIGQGATSQGWLAQLTLDSGPIDYDKSFGSSGQLKLVGPAGECVKAMGIDGQSRITVLLGGAADGKDRIIRLSL